jgi:hypothetical protein
MLKNLVFVLVPLFAGCKTDASTSSSASKESTQENAPSGTKARSGKIDLPNARPRPSAGDDDQDTKQSRQERRQQRMAEIDSDGDGEISDAEREAWRAKREAEMKARLDTNKDGVISDDERAAASHQRAMDMHARFDKDGDGKLTPAELEQTPFGRFDTTVDSNNDGNITVDELDAAMKERMQNGRGGFRGRRRGGMDGSGAPPTE